MSNQHVNYVADTVSLFAIIGTFGGLFPPMAALGAFAWYCIQIWESKTVKTWRAHRAAKKKPLDTSQ